jgi:ERF superfamily
MKHSESICNVATALAKAQGEMPNPKKEAENAFLSKPNKPSLYADLAGVINAVEPSLTKFDLALMQFVESGDKEGDVAVTTMLVHGKSGEWFSSTVAAHPVDGKPQTVGTVATYLRRYSALAMVFRTGEDDDDDANEGSGRAEAEDQTQETVTEDQAQELDALRVDADVNADTFKKYFGIAGKPLTAMPASSFEKAKEMLKKAAAKKAKERG